MQEPKTCLYQYCDNDIISRRADAKYCCLKCKNGHHADLTRAKALKITGDIDKILHKSRDILEEYYDRSQEYTEIPLLPLIEKGFNTRVYTGRGSSRDSIIQLYAYYNYAVKYMENNNIVIYKNDDGFHTI